MSACIAGGVVILAAFGTAGCSGSEKAAPATAIPAAESTQPATSDDLTFGVTGLKCGVKKVGPADLSERSSGQFCLVSVRVKNIGGKPVVFDDTAQRAVDSRGRQYPVAELATVYLNDKDPNLLEEIQPGAQVDGVLPFQVPAEVQLTAIMLHSSPSTPSVRMDLS